MATKSKTVISYPDVLYIDSVTRTSKSWFRIRFTDGSTQSVNGLKALHNWMALAQKVLVEIPEISGISYPINNTKLNHATPSTIDSQGTLNHLPPHQQQQDSRLLLSGDDADVGTSLIEEDCVQDSTGKSKAERLIAEAIQRSDNVATGKSKAERIIADERLIIAEAIQRTETVDERLIIAERLIAEVIQRSDNVAEGLDEISEGVERIVPIAFVAGVHAGTNQGTSQGKVPAIAPQTIDAFVVPEDEDDGEEFVLQRRVKPLSSTPAVVQPEPAPVAPAIKCRSDKPGRLVEGTIAAAKGDDKGTVVKQQIPGVVGISWGYYFDEENDTFHVIHLNTGLSVGTISAKTLAIKVTKALDKALYCSDADRDQLASLSEDIQRIMGGKALPV